MKQQRKRVRPDRQIAYTRILGIVFCSAGFVTIGFGWNGMARVACADCQLPYLLSGGATGVGLILFGVTLLILAQIRAERMRLEENFRQLGVILTKSARATDAVPAISPNGFVVAGRSSYHRPDCQIVQGKQDLDQLTPEQARLRGLSPCRICNPAEPDIGEIPSELAAEPVPATAETVPATAETVAAAAETVPATAQQPAAADSAERPGV